MTTIRIFNDSEEQSQDDVTTAWSMDDVKDYVKQYVVYEQQIKDLKESRKEWSQEFLKDKSIPKKELAQALRAAKAKIDMDVVNEIYENIEAMFGDSDEE